MLKPTVYSQNVQRDVIPCGPVEPNRRKLTEKTTTIMIKAIEHAEGIPVLENFTFPIGCFCAEN